MSTYSHNSITKPYAPSMLCQLNGGCMGCCGNSFESTDLIKEAIKINSKEFTLKNPQTTKEYEEFRDRAYSQDLRNGVCRNLIQVPKEQSGANNRSNSSSCQVLCPLHPTRHQGSDLRIGHCDIHHLCKTAKQFKVWDKQTQEQFLQLIKQKNLDNIEYSLQMKRHTLLEEFETKKTNSKNH